jgi:phosphoglycerate dehydrogenase-like enzyme
MTRTILITAEFSDSAVKELTSRGYRVERAGWGITRRIAPEDEFIQVLNHLSAEIVVTELETVSRAVLEACRSIRLVATCRGDPTNVDVIAAAERGIPVLCTPGRNAVSVADFTMGLLLALARDIPFADAYLRTGNWHIQGDLPYFHFRGPELEGKTLGLIGCGAIGRLVGQRAHGFGMNTLIFDPYLTSEQVGDTGRLAALDSVLRESDFISIHCPLTPESRGLLGYAALRKMKPTAYLINTARAAVVDEEALYRALTDGQLAGAALDVLWQEPLPPASAWITMKHVIITPHIAGASLDVVRRHSQMIVEDLGRYEAGERPRHLVNPSAREDVRSQEDA